MSMTGKSVLLLCAAFAAAASIDGASQNTGAPADIENIQHLIADYAVAVDTADVKRVAQIWSDSPEVSFIHPLGHEHGLDQIEQNVFRHLMGDTFSERTLTIKDVSIHTYGDTAWAEFYWDFKARLRKDGTALATKGRETQIYHREQGKWRLVHVHYSGMPATEERSGF
jgi:ketosteroid isomerase-like protein